MATTRMETFLRLSSELTAFRVIELVGTGNSEAYLATVDKIVGAPIVDELLAAYTNVASGEGAAREQQMRRAIFGNEKLGPIARNIIKLWYVGIWYQLPRTWTEANGAREGDVTFTVSPNAYTEALLWPAIGANPAGARAPGYASWTTAPRLPQV